MVQWSYRTFRSLRVQLGATFLGFLLLIGGSVTATFMAIHTQNNDAVVINLAGRQRMLSQKMTWLALSQADSPALISSIQHFEQTLYTLRDGGLALDSTGQSVILPPAPDPVLRNQLDEVIQTWAIYQDYLKSPPPRSSTETSPAEAESVLLLAQLDAVVNGFETRAEAKLFRLQLIQAAFFVAALLLLAWGYFLIQRRIMSPLGTLQIATRRIAEGSMAHPIPAMENDELDDLGRAFETMRVEVAAARNQLETRVAQRTHELTTAFEFSQEIVTELELNQLLSSVTERARALTQAQAVALCLLAPDKEYLELAASSGEAVIYPGLRQSVKRDLSVQVVCAGQTIVNEVSCFNCDFLKTHPSGQCAVTPLRAGEQTLGALCVVRPGQRTFDSDETRALTLLANSAAIAIANAHLVETGRRQAEQAAALAERERLAANLHDNLAQTLSFLNLKADRVTEILADQRPSEAETELNQMKSAIDGAYGQVRAALVGLREPIVVADNLAKELKTCLADFRETTGLTADLTIVDPTALALPDVAQRQALRIVHEALTNIHRHAQAQQVWVCVERANGESCFSVKDDGCGFNPTGVKGHNHLGLTIMQARAERMGGRLVIDSAPGAGTKIVAHFPL